MVISNEDKTPSEQIDAICKNLTDWRGKKLKTLRAVIIHADKQIIEEVKWKKPSKPEGVPVWSYDGIICIADTLKIAVRLTFPKGALLKDPKKLFNTRLESKSVRAIDFFEEDSVNEIELTTLIIQCMNMNLTNKNHTK